MNRFLISLLLRVSAVLWVVWGLVHVAAGVLTISGDTATAARGIADAVDPVAFDMVFPEAMGAIINQHGFNLLWIGLVTVVSALFIWRRNVPAIFLAALVGGLADVGYFVFLDLGGFVEFIPGGFMTWVSATAILTSLVAWYSGLRQWRHVG